MKQILFSILLLCAAFSMRAQNLVYNGDFETYNSCPIGYGQTVNCVGWRSFTSGTSDFFHTCGTGNGNSPATGVGYQYPASGNGFTGGISYSINYPTSDYKEYVAGILTSQLQVGQPYDVSVSVNLANAAGWACNDIGIFFYDTGPNTYGTIGVPSVSPQIMFPTYGIITDTQNWVRLNTIYYPDSTYDNIVIGGWTPTATLVKTTIQTGDYAYYYFDSLVVKPSLVFLTNYKDSILCSGDIITVAYTGGSPGYFQNGNVFTLQLSDALGSFATPTVLASQVGTGPGSISAIIPSTLTPGTGYRLRVKSSNALDSTNISLKPITIGVLKPAKPVITSNSPVCNGSTLSLNATTSTTGVSYKWTGPNLFTSTIQNPSISNVTVAAVGSYIVTAWLYGCYTKDTTTFVVNPMPLPVTANSNAPVCEGQVLGLVSTSGTPGCNYSWAGPNSFTSSQQYPTINNVPLAASGDYIVTANLNGCVVKDTVTATILAAPTNINATSNSAICNGQTLNLNVTNGTTGVSYSWTGPNSFTSTQQSPAIFGATTAASGNYITTLSINGCALKDTVTVVVHPIPGIPTASSNTPVCQGNPINLTSGGSLAGATYTWIGPNSFATNQQNPIINNANTGMSGNYSVTATLNGCTSAAASTSVTVLYSPSSVIAYPLPKDTICVGGTIQFVAVASNGGANPQYKWMKNSSVISGATAISYTASNMITGDKFRAVLTPDNTCPDPDTSAEITVAVLPYVTPSVTITASPGTLISPWQTITFTAVPVNGGKAPTYQWKRNGQNIIGAVIDTWGAYTLSNNDTISVEMFSNEYCPSPASASSNKIIVAVKTGIDDVKSEDGLVLYPNPNNGNFTLKGSFSSQQAEIEVWNKIGQLVHREVMKTKNGMLDANISLNEALATGVYLLRIKSTNENIVLRFTVDK